MSDLITRLQTELTDRYTVEKELGRGGMATVFLATDIKHDRAVAIKVLHPELAMSIGGDRFEREIRLAAKLQHPHILGLYDSGQADGLLFYVMPFVEGESLRDRIDRESQLPVEDAIQITLEVADALGHAHAQGIVHRDIKPENILLANGHALVADFGIARAATEGGGQKLTQTGMAVGTPVYMAPEQAVGEAAGPTADLYSLGCVLFEMLAGEPPFTGKNAQAIMARHAMETVPSIRIIRATVPEEVEEAIFAALGKVPADRPQTAAHFAELLGIPLGSTATRRVATRHTSTRRVPGMPTQTQPVGFRGRPVTRRVLFAGLVLVGVGAGALAWQLWGGGTRGSAGGVAGLDPHNVAVLYFADASRTGDLGFLADGLTEELIGSLARVEGLRVISRGGVEGFRSSTLGEDSIARILKTGTIIRGDVDRDGDRIRVNVQVIDGQSGAPYERFSIRRPEGEELALRDSVAPEVGRRVLQRLGEEIQVQARLASTGNVEAWSLLQRAEQVRKRGETAGNEGDLGRMDQEFRVADSLLSQVETLDDGWAEPPILRGLIAYQRSRIATRDPYEIGRWLAEGRTHVDRALTIDPLNPDGLELRGNIRYWGWLVGLEQDSVRRRAALDSAQADLERATELNRGQAGAWATLSHLYYQTATQLEVRDAAREALNADAFLSNADVVLNRLFLASYDLEAFPEADRRCQEIRARFPASLNAARCELYMYTARGARNPDVDRLWRLVDSVVEATPEPRRAYQRLNATMLAAAGIARASQTDSARQAVLADSARRVIERSQGDAEADPTRDLLYTGAFGYAILGDMDPALEFLRTYVAFNDQRRQGLAIDPGWWFRELSRDPRWRRYIGSE